MPVFLADEQGLEVDAEDLLALARTVLADRRVPEDMEVSLLLVDETTIAGLNAEHLGHEGPTDVLAFPMDEPGESPPAGPAVLGDVVLCPAVARAQAAEHRVTPQDELRLLTVHGLLHLRGVDPAAPAEEREMTARTRRRLDLHAARGAA
ncbi:MAG: rRNA maturation RNase YbeY [Nitriliruptoraceae bacterium]